MKITSKSKLKCFLLGLICFSAFTGTALAEPNNQALLKQIEQLRKALDTLEDKVRTQSQEIKTLKEERSLGDQSVGKLGAKQVSFNPEIGIIGDLVAASSQSSEDEEGNDKLSVRELELVFGHDVDPFSRFDVTVSLSDFEDVSLEEAYLTHWGLSDLNFKIGKFRQRIGITNALHRDSLDTVDEPLVIQKYFGVEGLSNTGIETSLFLPSISDRFTQEIIAGFMEGGVGESGTLLGETRRHPSFYLGLKNFWEISDSTTATLGGNWLIGSADQDSAYEVNLFGVNAVLDHYFSPIQRLRLLGEAFVQSRTEGVEGSSYRSHPFGAYALGDYRFLTNWAVGLRYDYVEEVSLGEDTSDFTNALSPYLTFHQSEFARWRLQYQRVLDGPEGDDNRFWLQGTFAIGTHKHQLN